MPRALSHEPTAIVGELPTRPTTVATGAALLSGSALVLALTWALGIDAIDSNGARVFFIVVWGYLAWSSYRGGGWVRWAIVAIFAASIWGDVNAPAFIDAITAMPAGEVTAKILALLALVVLCLPTARRWFAAAREFRVQMES